MRCPFCGHEDTQVKDSRPTDDNSAIRRRRYCPSCGSRFTTFERVQLRELTVVKKNGQRVAFDRDKLARSISVACRKRPVRMLCLAALHFLMTLRPSMRSCGGPTALGSMWRHRHALQHARSPARCRAVIQLWRFAPYWRSHRESGC